MPAVTVSIPVQLPKEAILAQILARLCALNSTDATITSLLAQYVALTGINLGQ